LSTRSAASPRASSSESTTALLIFSQFVEGFPIRGRPGGSSSRRVLTVTAQRSREFQGGEPVARLKAGVRIRALSAAIKVAEYRGSKTRKAAVSQQQGRGSPTGPCPASFFPSCVGSRPRMNAVLDGFETRGVKQRTYDGQTVNLRDLRGSSANLPEKRLQNNLHLLYCALYPNLYSKVPIARPSR
jgi:hypothetical protein